MKGSSNEKDKDNEEKITSTAKIHDVLLSGNPDLSPQFLNNRPNLSDDLISIKTKPDPLDCIEIPAELKNNGTVKINIYPTADRVDSSNDKIKAEIIYTPEQGFVETGPMFLSYRNDIGFGNLIEMKQQNGSWIATREMLPNESSELCIHRTDPRIGKGPPDFNTPDNFKTQIPLIDARIVTEVFKNPSLSIENKTGSIQKRIYKKDNSFSEPLNDNSPAISPDEEMVHVYLPNGFNENNANSYPLIVMLDGDMHVGTDAYGNKLSTPDILDNLIAEGKIEPAIVIFSAPTSPNDNRYTQTKRICLQC